MTLPEQMKFYRARERISQKELARRCGVSLQTINSIETGVQHPSEITEIKIKMVIDDNKEERQ